MIRRPPGEWIDARNADNRRPDRSCRQARRHQVDCRARPLCAYHEPIWALSHSATGFAWAEKAAHDPHSRATLFNLVVVPAEPAPDLFGRYASLRYPR